MKNFTLLIIVSLSIFLNSCSDDDSSDLKIQNLNYSFQNGTDGWIGDFADYPNEENVETFYELEFRQSPLPDPLDTNDGALKQKGNNHSDDLFMFIKRKLDGLDKNQMYEVIIEIEFATNAAEGSFGIGGSPANSVYLKAGVSTIEPRKVLDTTEGIYRLNIDKGNQATDGEDLQLIGDFSNGTEEEVYVLKQLSTEMIQIESNEDGELWLIIGTDSGFEGTTTIYYNEIKVSLTKI
ncbi:hypothetical protein SAMN03097699_1717 [Flavobacteriaceae bacterium MAR_2010_188]|nr:hypothetical protein SAMN03097699_1717 [Flavobacteriaceae bacterium MAR_2010_188]